MPAKYGKSFIKKVNAKKNWDKWNTGQGIGSLYGGNQTSSVTKQLNVKTVDEDRASEMF